MLRSIVLNCMLLAGFSLAAQTRTPSDEVKSKIDAVISKAYESASAQFPCKLGTSGKPKMLEWQTLGKCLSRANGRVDWGEVSMQLQEIRKDSGFDAAAISGLVDSSLSAHALPYEKIFAVKKMNALLPLSSSLLKFLPEGSLQDLPVFSKSGTQIGTFAGPYSFEKAGELSGRIESHRLFQYTDSKGELHGSPDVLLLDSFAVPWKSAVSQPGFRLPSDKIVLR
ncbi:MAG: hypothetical protein ABSC60_02950 [Acidobacteriota bacterium]